MRAALAAHARGEANLNALLRALQQASAGIKGAREANHELGEELERLRDLLAESGHREAELGHRVRELEQRLARVEDDALRDRKFLIDEQDAFIVSLCNDHEREVAELWQRLSGAVSGNHAVEEHAARIAELEHERERAQAVQARLQAQRDEAHAMLVRIASERDQALTELARANLPRSRPSSSAPRASGVDSRPALSLRLQQSERLTERRPASAPRHPRLELDGVHEDPPPELAAALTPPPPRSSSKPVLPSQASPTSRPLIGYALGASEVAAERIDTGAISTRRPTR